MATRVTMDRGGDEVKPKDLIKMLEADGWKLERVKGSHYIFKHSEKSGRPIVPFHNKDLRPGTLHQILKDAGLK